MAGRPPGAQNKDKPFRDALRAELAGADGDFKELREIAKGLIAQAKTGDVQAVREIGDRLDGKPAQAVVGDDDKDPIQMVVSWLKQE